jgi:hypothetical protein
LSATRLTIIFDTTLEGSRFPAFVVDRDHTQNHQKSPVRVIELTLQEVVACCGEHAQASTPEKPVKPCSYGSDAENMQYMVLHGSSSHCLQATITYTPF